MIPHSAGKVKPFFVKEVLPIRFFYAIINLYIEKHAARGNSLRQMEDKHES